MNDIQMAHRFAARLSQNLEVVTREGCPLDNCPLERVEVIWKIQPNDENLALKAFRKCSNYCPIETLHETELYDRAVQATMASLGMQPSPVEDIKPVDGTA